MKENKKLISEILADVRHDMTDEEILNLLASSRISVNPEKESGKLTSLGQRAADSIAKFAGSWAFIFSFTGVLLAWMILNVLLAAKAFDPYPFILLNLVLSCVAAIQAPLIMMSQNRQEEKDRARAENDYKVNLKTEIMIEALHDKLNRILAREELLLQVQRITRSRSLKRINGSAPAGRPAPAWPKRLRRGRSFPQTSRCRCDPPCPSRSGWPQREHGLHNTHAPWRLSPCRPSAGQSAH